MHAKVYQRNKTQCVRKWILASRNKVVHHIVKIIRQVLGCLSLFSSFLFVGIWDACRARGLEHSNFKGIMHCQLCPQRKSVRPTEGVVLIMLLYMCGGVVVGDDNNISSFLILGGPWACSQVWIPFGFIRTHLAWRTTPGPLPKSPSSMPRGLTPRAGPFPALYVRWPSQTSPRSEDLLLDGLPFSCLALQCDGHREQLLFKWRVEKTLLRHTRLKIASQTVEKVELLPMFSPN